MKKTIYNFGAIVFAFIIGFAINSACGDNLDNMSNAELRNLVSQLQQEVNSLKQKVLSLEEEKRLFEVDGVCYLPSGEVSDRIKTSNMKMTMYNPLSGTSVINYTYRDSYDSFGRITRREYNYDGYEYYFIDYSYEGKTVRSTTESKNSSSTVTKTEVVTEYY